MLLAEIDATLDRFAADPLQWLEVCPNVGRILVKRYPYALFVKTGADAHLVIAVFHAKRNPHKWRKRV